MWLIILKQTWMNITFTKLKPKLKNSFVTLMLIYFFILNIVHCLYVPSREGKENFITDFTFQPSGVERNILNLIQNTQKSITISLYGFDNNKIADALIAAHKNRGIKIRMSTEYDSEEHYASWRKVIREGIPVRLGNISGIMHNKYLIFDDEYIVTGSTNLTSGMFTHFNNTIVLKDKRIIEEYKKDFEVQYAGYYASKKVDGYQEIFGLSTWQPGTYEIAGMQITPYFTPYKETIVPYEQNILKGKLKYSPTDNTTACFAKKSGDGDYCDIGRTPCNDTYYYDNSSNPGTTYKYHNPDGDSGAGRDYCKKYDHALNIVIKELREAIKSITLLVFAFTDRVIMQELTRAKKEKNLNVKVWMDRSQYRSSCGHSIQSFKKLAENINEFKITRRPNSGLLHHKVIIIDESTVILGSMNFSSNAVNNNDENFLLIKNAGVLARKFKNEITKIDKASYYVSNQPEVVRLKSSNIKRITDKNQRKAEVKRICSAKAIDKNENIDADQGGEGL